MTPSSSKLPRRDDVSRTTSPDWASLDKDLVDLIAWRVLAGDLPDYVRFRAACSDWTTSTVSPRGRGLLDARFHPRRWMMLPEGHGIYPGHPALRGGARFFNLSTGAFVHVHLPLLDDHVILDSIDGLLLLCRDGDTAVRLLHPFTGDVAELPPLVSLLPQIEFPQFYYDDDEEENIEKSKRSGIMSARASVAVGDSGKITVMLALDLLHRVAYAAAGDRRWTLFEWKIPRLLKPVAFQGKIYGIESLMAIKKVRIYRIDPPHRDLDAADGEPSSAHLQLPVEIAEYPMYKFLILNFVECCSELLLVGYNNNGVSYSEPAVYRLDDIVKGTFEPVRSIGNRTFFRGA